MARKLNPKELIKKSYIDEIENPLTEEGVFFLEPGRCLNIDTGWFELPSLITDATSKELGEYLHAYTQQKVYLRTLLGRCELVLEIKKRDYFEASKDIYKRLSNQKVSETAKERIINFDDDIKPIYQEYSDYLNKKKILEYSITSIEDIIFMLSREVTRRSKDFDEDLRDSRV